MSNICIILAMFGTTQITGLKAVLNIEKVVKESFPEIPVKITFTSNVIRKIWKKRNSQKSEWLKKGIPEKILNIKGIISTIGEAIEEEFDYIIVQPTHIFYMEQVHDLFSYIKAFQSIKTMQKNWMPFKKIVMGRPALGTFSDKYHYREDIKKGLTALKDDIKLAKNKNSDLLYMAHGNDKFPMGIFYEIETICNELYPDINTVFSCVEGKPSFEESIKKLKNKNILLKPFMIVAGTHAKEDMIEWQDILSSQGYNVEIVMEGLGEKTEFAKIFVQHIKDVAEDNNILL